MPHTIDWWAGHADLLSAIAAVAGVVIAAASVIIAVVSIWLSGKAIRVQEKHNILSVRPIPFIALADYENIIRVKVRNEGSGPLVVFDFKVTDLTHVDGVSKVDVISWMPPLPAKVFWSNYSSWTERRAILPGNELILLELKGDAADAKFATFRDQVRDRLATLEMSFSYTDIYDTGYERFGRVFDWFSRNKA